jgi:hypothetical protein
MIQLIALIGLLIGISGVYYILKKKNKELEDQEVHTLPEESFVNQTVTNIAPRLNIDLKKIHPKEIFKKFKEGAWLKKTLMKTKVLLLKGENKVDSWLKKVSHSKKFDKETLEKKE